MSPFFLVSVQFYKSGILFGRWYMMGIQGFQIRGPYYKGPWFGGQKALDLAMEAVPLGAYAGPGACLLAMGPGLVPAGRVGTRLSDGHFLNAAALNHHGQYC